MQVHDVWMAVIVGFECIRLGYEISTVQVGHTDHVGRGFTSGIMVVLLMFAWYFVQ